MVISSKYREMWLTLARRLDAEAANCAVRALSCDDMNQLAAVKGAYAAFQSTLTLMTATEAEFNVKPRGGQNDA